MKRRKCIRMVLPVLLAFMMLLPTKVLAAGKINLNHGVSLTISCQDGGVPLTGARYAIYLVATTDAGGVLKPVSAFSHFETAIQEKDAETWRALASTLEGYILRDKLSPEDSGKVDENGFLTFPASNGSLTPGLYLVTGSHFVQNDKIYEITPFLVMLPGMDNKTHTWIYDLTVNAKFSSEPVTENPQPVSRKVLKVWEDEGHEDIRPEEVTVQLFQDGELYDTVILNEKNNWRHTWTKLEADHKWTLTENELNDYVPFVTEEGITFMVTNYYAPLSGGAAPDELTPTPTPTAASQPSGAPGSSTPSGGSGSSYSGSGMKLPQTGQLWWPVPFLTAAGLLLIVIGLIRRKGDHNED